jgi:O-antigen/teichoic acid export membrane protein
VRPARGRTGFVGTSLGLVAGKTVSLGVGFLFWVLAARTADVHDVGLAAGVVSLVMLATQLAIAGTGSSFILNQARFEERLPRLLDAAVTVVVLTGLTAGTVALGLVVLFLQELRPVATEPAFALLFVTMTVLGTLVILLDHVSVALGRGQQVLVRNTVNGLVAASPLLVVAALGVQLRAPQLFGVWVLGSGAACAVAMVQLRRDLPGHAFRPCLERELVTRLLRTGLPNHALTLVERAPNLLLPVVVAEVLSPQLNAYWYAAWMMAWAVLVVPVSIGVTLLAQVNRAAGALRGDVLRAGRTGLGLGACGAVALAATAPVALGLMGRDFRVEGVAPLRVLLIGLLPVLVLQLYYAVCRSTARLPEALVTGLLTGVAALVATGLVAGEHGLVGMAWAWVGVQALAGGWAVLRLVVLVPREAAGECPVPPQAQPLLGTGPAAAVPHR